MQITILRVHQTEMEGQICELQGKSFSTSQPVNNIK